MSLAQEVLNTIPHTPHAIESVKNFRGTQFNRTTYQLPKLKLGSIEFNHPIALGRPKQDGQEYVIWQSSYKESKQAPCGAIGRGLLKKTNLLIDMRCSLVILTDHKQRLKRDGYQLDTYVKVPFRLDTKGIIIDLETDLGQKRFLVDTGFTLTMLYMRQFPSDPNLAEREYNLPMLTSKRFLLGGREFGEKRLYFIEMTKDLEVFDGVLGMDFIAKHVVYIDFSESIIYVGES